MSQLRHSYPEFRGLGAEVSAVSTVGLAQQSDFARQLVLPFPALSDVNGQVYCAFGLGKGLAIHPRTPFQFARLVWNEKRKTRPTGRKPLSCCD